MEQPIGVWIDRRCARIYDLEHWPETPVTLIESEVDEHRGPHEAMRHVAPHRFGGSREHHVRRRRDQAVQSFYQRVAHALWRHPAVVIGGHDGACEELAAVLREVKAAPTRVLAITRLDTHLAETAVVDSLRRVGGDQARLQSNRSSQFG